MSLLATVVWYSYKRRSTQIVEHESELSNLSTILVNMVTEKNKRKIQHATDFSSFSTPLIAEKRQHKNGKICNMLTI